MSNFTFNNKHSYKDMDCIIVAPVVIPAINENVENIEIEGRKRGSLTVKTGSYKDSKISIKLQMNNIDNYLEQYFDKKVAIEEWLINIADNKLIFDDNKEKCYIVKDVILTDFEDYKRFYSRFEALFICEPFQMYLNEREITVNKNDVVNNPGAIASDPIIELKLPATEQNIQITINDKTFQLNNVKDSAYIDTSLYTCRNEHGNIRSVGEFPVLERGNNTITWSGNITEFKIKRNVLFRG